MRLVYVCYVLVVILQIYIHLQGECVGVSECVFVGVRSRPIYPFTIHD